MNGVLRFACCHVQQAERGTGRVWRTQLAQIQPQFQCAETSGFQGARTRLGTRHVRVVVAVGWQRLAVQVIAHLQIGQHLASFADVCTQTGFLYFSFCKFLQVSERFFITIRYTDGWHQMVIGNPDTAARHR